jgi:hypothetical protein
MTRRQFLLASAFVPCAPRITSASQRQGHRRTMSVSEFRRLRRFRDSPFGRLAYIDGIGGICYADPATLTDRRLSTTSRRCCARRRGARSSIDTSAVFFRTPCQRSSRVSPPIEAQCGSSGARTIACSTSHERHGSIAPSRDHGESVGSAAASCSFPKNSRTSSPKRPGACGTPDEPRGIRPDHNNGRST